MKMYINVYAFPFFLKMLCIAGETMLDEGSAYICGHSMQEAFIMIP